MSSISRQTLKLTAAALRPALQRNLATSYILAQAAATDPVQGLFLEKIRAYATAKKAAGGALVDATPVSNCELVNHSYISYPFLRLCYPFGRRSLTILSLISSMF